MLNALFEGLMFGAGVFIAMLVVGLLVGTKRKDSQKMHEESLEALQRRNALSEEILSQLTRIADSAPRQARNNEFPNRP